MIEVGNGISIDEGEIRLRFVRSRGPGGQHVNRSSTAVHLMFDVANSASLPDRVKRRLLRTAAGYLTGEGVIVLFADRFRSQRRNRQDATERLVGLIRAAARPVRPRVKTRRTAASIERRLDAKKRTGQRKKGRRWRQQDE